MDTLELPTQTPRSAHLRRGFYQLQSPGNSAVATRHCAGPAGFVFRSEVAVLERQHPVRTRAAQWRTHATCRRSRAAWRDVT